MHMTTLLSPDAAWGDVLKELATGDAGKGSGESPMQHWSSFIGIVTAIIGNLLISFALNTQRYAHILIDREHNELKSNQANGHAASSDAQAHGSARSDDAAEARRRINLGASDRKASVEEDGASSFGADSTQSTIRSEFQVRKSAPGPEKDGDDEGRTSYLKSPYWWLGLVLMITGEAGNFLAYGFAPASIVSPLGVVALISNCLIAPLMLKERFRTRDFWGVVIAIAGAVTVVLSAQSSEDKFGPGELWKTIKRWEFLLYLALTLLLVVSLMYVEPQYCRRTILVDLGLVGLFGGYTALSTKGVASLLSASLWKAFTYPITYLLAFVLISSALMQIRYLNRALQYYDSTQVIPTQFVLFTLSVIIGSAVLYRDFEHTTAQQAVKFIVGCLLTFFGVYLITSGRDQEGDMDMEDSARGEDVAIQLIDDEADQVDERTPLNRDTARFTSRPRDGRRRSTEARESQTPVPNVSSSPPSVAVTPAAPFDGVPSNPWATSADEIDMPPPPRTPQIARLQSEEGVTPFFTPATSRYANRIMSTPIDLDTPSKQPSPRVPSPTRSAQPPMDDPSPSPSFLNRSARGSISRLLPVPRPLLSPLSSSLSALVADSLLRGEGAPRSVRAALNRTRSARQSIDDRRRPVPVSDEENPLGLDFQGRGADEDLRRMHTRDTMPIPAARTMGDDSDDEENRGTPRTRLRALSETLSVIIGRGHGRADTPGKTRDSSDGKAGGDGPGPSK